MDYTKHLVQLATHLGLDFDETVIQMMLALLENNVTPENLVKILEDIKHEIKRHDAMEHDQITK